MPRPLLEAIRATDPVVLLIDEVDRVEVETEALLLEVLSDYQVSVPEMGTVKATQIPLVFLTSNNTRELSEALETAVPLPAPRLPVGRSGSGRSSWPRCPGIEESLADQVVRTVKLIRALELKKAAFGLGNSRLGAHARAARGCPTSTRPRPGRP